MTSYDQWPLLNDQHSNRGVEQSVRDRSGVRPQMAATPGSASGSNGTAALAHISGIFTWVVGPAVCYAVARPGSALRKEAAKAFNYQLTAGLLLVGASIVLGILGVGQVIGLLWLGWLGLAIFGAAKAGSGQDWANPVSRYIRVAPLPTDGR